MGFIFHNDLCHDQIFLLVCHHHWWALELPKSARIKPTDVSCNKPKKITPFFSPFTSVLCRYLTLFPSSYLWQICLCLICIRETLGLVTENTGKPFLPWLWWHPSLQPEAFPTCLRVSVLPWAALTYHLNILTKHVIEITQASSSYSNSITHGNENIGNPRVKEFVLYLNPACKMLAEVQLMDRKRKSVFYQFRITWEGNLKRITKAEGWRKLFSTEFKEGIRVAEASGKDTNEFYYKRREIYKRSAHICITALHFKCRSNWSALKLFQLQKSCSKYN